MTTTAAVPPYRGTVFYERKVNSEQRGTGYGYENEVAAVHIAFDVDPEDEAATAQAARDAIGLAKAVVYTELGLKFETGADGVVREVVDLQAATAVAKTRKAFAKPTTTTTKKAAPKAAVSEDGLSPECPECGNGMYDNRASKKNPKAPDFRCTKYKAGCEGVIWPNQTKELLELLESASGQDFGDEPF